MPFPAGRRRSALLAALLIAGSAVGLAACGGDDGTGDSGAVLELSAGTVPPDGPGIVLGDPAGGALPRAGRYVAMVGDSLTVGATAGLEAAAASLDIDLRIDAEIGRRITSGSDPDSGIDAVTELLDEYGTPDLWVVALGTNDVGQYSTPEEYADQINALLALIPADAPLVWIDVYLSVREDASEQFDQVLTEILTQRGNATIGTWSSIATGDGMLSGDGVHPSDEGSAQFVTVVTSRIQTWMASS